MEDLTYASATRLARAINREEISSYEVVEAYIRRIEEVNPKLNAVVQLLADEAIVEAEKADAAVAEKNIKGPLHGVPITVKDNIDVAGIVSTAGTKGRVSFVPERDAVAVKRLRDAGAIVIGKTNMPELGLAFETENLIYGRTNNPYDLTRSPGGSSGGEAAIIAAGGSPLGLGNDMGGSVRLPAHLCGIAAIKPTAGRVPRTGTFPWPGGWFDFLWQTGPMARFVEDLALALPVICGIDWCDPMVEPVPLGSPDDVNIRSLRVAFHTDNGIVEPTVDVVRVAENAASALSDAGVHVEESRPEGIERSFEIFSALGSADGGAGVRQVLRRVGSGDVHPWLQALLDFYQANVMTTAQLSSLMYGWTIFRSAMLSFLKEYDVILCPVCAYAAQPHGVSLKAEKVLAFSYTMTYNLTGWPSAVVRCGSSQEGLPIGMQIVSRPWREDVALAVAQHLETALGGFQPPLI